MVVPPTLKSKIDALSDQHEIGQRSANDSSKYFNASDSFKAGAAAMYELMKENNECKHQSSVMGGDPPHYCIHCKEKIKRIWVLE